jgi:Phosphotransferase enzyme family
MALTLEAIIADHLRDWERAHVDLAIHGSGDARVIAQALDQFCRRELGSPVAEGLFYRSSIGAVAGVALADGRRVVIKAHQPDWSAEQLRAVVALQRHVASVSGLAPNVLAGPSPVGQGLAVVEDFAARGSARDAHEPVIRASLARQLHRLIRCLDAFVPSVELRPHPLASLPSNSLWPRPHSRLFDFESTPKGAADIDRVARRARERLQRAGRTVICHGDWRAEHVRFEGAEAVVAYDWDSLCRVGEPFILGMTAHMFCADWSRSDIAQAPTLSEAQAFVSDYEAARGQPFTRAERRVCGAAFAYSVAYTARCGHSVGLDQRGEPGSHQYLVATEALGLLEL